MFDVKLTGSFATMEEVTKFYRLLSHALPATHFDSVAEFLEDNGYVIDHMKEEYVQWITARVRR